MRTIIAGSRSIMDPNTVDAALKWAQAVGLSITQVVSGTATGVDKLGELWAGYSGITVKRFRPDWDRYGKSAGFRRNAEMAAYAEALLAVWDGDSNGTRHMIDQAKARDLHVYVFNVKTDQHEVTVPFL